MGSSNCRNWETDKVKNLIKSKRNGIYKKKEFHGQGVRIVNMGELFEYDFITDQKMELIELNEKEKNKFLLEDGDLLFARRSLVLEGSGKCSLVVNPKDDITFESSIIRLRPNKEIADPKFYFYYFSSPKGRSKIMSIASQTAVSGIRSSDLIELEVDVPPLNKQKQIASKLTSFDRLIKNNSRRIEILEEMARRIYREWFVHFRYPGHEDDELVDSDTDEFDAVPEGWDLKIMDEILEHYIGGTWGQEEPEGEENNPAYVIRGTDIPGGRSGNIDDIPLRYHKQSYINSRKLRHGDIVFEVSGGSKDQPVGRAMLITDTFLSELDCDDVVHASFCKLLRSDKSTLKPEILYLHIREIYDDRRIMKYQVQSTGITNFKFTFFAENKHMFIPPMDLQEKFQEKVSPLFKQMYILGKQINRLKETRDLLLPKLISGKIEVEELNIN